MTTSKAWSPPDKPDPSEILHEGVADTREGRYEMALAKFLWFHEHALKYRPSQSAVRLSFALSYWFDLATVFPRALDALCATRDRCEKALEESRYDFEHFHELAAINRVLGEGSRTSLVFKRL